MREKITLVKKKRGGGGGGEGRMITNQIQVYYHYVIMEK